MGASVYQRGAMTLAALRNRIGDDRLRDDRCGRGSSATRGGHGTGAEFRALAEEVSGEDLDGFFPHWLDDTDQARRAPRRTDWAERRSRDNGP